MARPGGRPPDLVSTSPLDATSGTPARGRRLNERSPCHWHPNDSAIGLRRLFTSPGRRPLRRGRVGAPRRPHHATGRTARSPSSSSASSSRSSGRSTPPTSSPRSTSAARSARPGGSRRCARSSTASPTPSPTWGREGGYFVDDDEADGVQRRAEVHPRHPAGRLQQPGVVQHRRRRRAAAGRRRASSSPSTTRWTRSSTGTARRASSSRAAPAPASTCRRSAPAPSCCNGGGTASGPVSFMRGADASAGTIKSRRQDPPRRQDGHPRRRPPRRRGVHLVQGQGGAQGARAARRRLRHGPRRRPTRSRIQYQNANNSVRVTDEFMQAVADDADWGLVAVTTGEVLRTVQARDLWRQIAQAAWECADPGLQFDTTINRWHTAHTTGPHQRLATRAGSTCTSTTRPATWRRSTCCKYLDDDGQLRRRRLPAHGRDHLHGAGDPRRPGRLPDASRSPRRAATSASSASATPTSAPC